MLWNPLGISLSRTNFMAALISHSADLINLRRLVKPLKEVLAARATYFSQEF